MYKQRVAIVTSTIGRDELIRAIESVKAQTYPCRHYIFVDGEQFADKVKALVAPYQDLVVTYLPMNTGKNGMVNSSINAIAPFLVEEDIICYLDDDNWYEPHHVEALVNVLEEGADFAYSLRNFYTLDGEFICPDDWESLGYWKMQKDVLIRLNFQDEICRFIIWAENQDYHIDTNCYAFRKQTALLLAQDWFTGKHNDRNVYNKLKSLNMKGVCSKVYSVNYLIDLASSLSLSKNKKLIGKLEELGEKQQTLSEILKVLCKDNIKHHNDSRPWAE